MTSGFFSSTLPSSLPTKSPSQVVLAVAAGAVAAAVIVGDALRTRVQGLERSEGFRVVP